MHAAYPALRLRRTRIAAWSRALHRETVLTPADLIWPLFIAEGRGVEEPIASLPGVSRWSVDGIVARAREAHGLGIACIALFPNTPTDRRTEDGAEATNPDNLMCRAIRADEAMRCGDDIGVLADVALDPYTSHGQDGLVDGARLCDATTPRWMMLARSGAQCWREAGADIVAPIRHDGWPHRG